MGDSHMGLQARLMSKLLRKITGNIGKSGCTVVPPQSIAAKNRCHVWQSRNDNWRQCFEVLRLCSFRHPPDSNPEEG